jgi:hypothetical protein
VSALHRFAAALLEFVIGDDWRVALGVALALAITAVAATAGLAAWLVMPPAVLLLLALSTLRAAQRTRPRLRKRTR